MTEPTPIARLTRVQLYELVWSTPATKLVKTLGVSDVAIAKRCRRLGVPRPQRGYWAKLESGKACAKPALPPKPPTVEAQFAASANEPIAASTALPKTGSALHPLASEFLAALEKAPLGYDKQRVHLEERALPKAEISKSQAPRAARTFHALLALVEPRGIAFVKSRSKYETGRFRKRNADLHLKIEEGLVERVERSGRRSGYNAVWRQENKVAGGRLAFLLNPESYGQSTEKRWTESEQLPLETIVSEMAKAIVAHYAELEKKREDEAIRREKEQLEWEIRRKQEEEAEALRRKEKAERKHTETVETAVHSRREDLLHASEWWRIHQSMGAFIAECERRWRADQAENLSPAQQAWVNWAHEVARLVSPFETGYPDPAKDGAFDPAMVPFGGPYPELRKFPRPPTMPEIPAPIVVRESYGSPVPSPDPKPYPFWLRYQRR